MWVLGQSLVAGLRAEVPPRPCGDTAVAGRPAVLWLGWLLITI